MDCGAPGGLKCRGPVSRRDSSAGVAKPPSPAQRRTSIVKASECQRNSRGKVRNPGVRGLPPESRQTPSLVAALRTWV
eukprot:5581922-Alexandrium_andersonii.AAC.1